MIWLWLLEVNIKCSTTTHQYETEIENGIDFRATSKILGARREIKLAESMRYR